MERRIGPGSPLARWISAFLLTLAACREEPRSEAPHSPDNPFLADLRQRCQKLQPHVEREIGRTLGDVEILVLSHEERTENFLPWERKILSRIENGPQGEALEAEARAISLGAAEWSVANVDREDRIVFADEDVEAQLGEFVDLVLIHELIHVHQHRHLESASFYESIRSRADILARRAVVEGHAEYLTRKIASRIGLADSYEKQYRTGLSPNATTESARVEESVLAAARYFPYRQGRNFLDFVVDKLGYDKAIQRVFKDPPSLAAVSRPEEYFGPSKPSQWGPLLEDLRRWLTRERGDANLHAIGLPMVRELAGDAARAFREGFRLDVGVIDVQVHVLIADSASGARALHQAWTEGIEKLSAMKVEEGLALEVRRTREPDHWSLHHVIRRRCGPLSHFIPPVGHVRRTVIREGRLIIDVRCEQDSELEQGAERLAHRAIKFLTNTSWRKAWLEGGKELLKSEDAELRIAAVSRMRRFVPDENWEVRWLGRWYEARDESKSEKERTAVLVGAIEDPHPAVVRRGLLAASDMSLREIPWPLLSKQFSHEEACVRRAAWAFMSSTSLLSVLELSRKPGIAAMFRKALADDDAWVRFQATLTLTIGIDFQELLPDLLAQLDENPEGAAKALGSLGQAAGKAVPRLREALKKPEGRVEVAQAIWSISGDPEPLFVVVRESIAEGKPRGIRALGDVPWSKAWPMVPELATALAHEDVWVRFLTADALGKIGGRSAREALRRRLEVEKNSIVLKSIREALDKIREELGPLED